MPQVGSDLWKAASSFYWWREYLDGRIEQEFNLETGQIRPWGSKTPDILKKAGWLPVTQDLARKMQTWGEFGIPTQSPSIIIGLKPGEQLEIFKECTILDGHRIHCKACGAIYRAFGEDRGDGCIRCGAKPAWRCPKCDKLSDAETCPDCNLKGRMIDPLERTPDRWEDVVYFLGIKGLYQIKFNSSGLIVEH
jgi:predicted RNA-binding Zn-ribbon protein involved in translation (DUF1610 family)